MKVLVCAIACHPEGGSESYVGWSAVTALARRHALTVLTHGHSRAAIERVLPSLPGRDNLRFCFIGEEHGWHPNRLIARFQDWQRYRVWTAEAKVLAGKLAGQEQFDLAHHVTYATWRIPSPLAELGLPWILGPVGGGESFPTRFFSILSPVAKAFELVRTMANAVGERSGAVRKAVRDAGFCLPNNRETAGLLQRLGVREDRIRILSQSFFTPARVERFLFEGEKPPVSEKLRIFAGGNLEGRKGVAIVLRALKILHERGIPFEFLYGGKGPELSFLQKLSDELALAPGSVRLGEILTPGGYVDAVRASHVYALPSLREGAPLTMIEAMLAGCAPIVADCGGATMLVDDECGRAIRLESPEQMVREVAETLVQWQGDPLRLAALGKAARERVLERCVEASYLAEMDGIYEELGKRK